MGEEKGQQSEGGSGFAGEVLRSPLSSTAPRPSRGGPGQSLGLWRRLLLRPLHFWFWLSRGMTLGVRAIVINAEGAVFLVRHTYVPGWHLPGGGVEWGQSTEEALRIELLEEGHIEMRTSPALLGIYAQQSVSRRDHVLLYLVSDAIQLRPRLADREIAESGFFPLDQLPPGTTRATRQRLAEWLGHAPRSQVW